MIIRKQFKFEGAHIVRNCSSDRCKKSLHGHSYIVELCLTADGLDNGGMIVDFGLLKGTIGDVVDSFDHAHSIWNKEDDKYKGFMKSWSDRWITMPCTPSAESYALMFFYIIDKIVKNTVFNNGEKNPRVHSVRVHETATGWAEAFRDDLEWVNYSLADIIFSDGVRNEWKDVEMWEQLLNGTPFENPIVSQQIR